MKMKIIIKLTGFGAQAVIRPITELAALADRLCLGQIRRHCAIMRHELSCLVCCYEV